MSSSVRVGMAPWVKIIRMLAGALGGVGAKMLRALVNLCFVSGRMTGNGESWR